MAGLPAAFIEYEGVPKEDQEKGLLKFFSHVFLRDGQVFQIIAIAPPVLFGRLKREAAEAIRTFSFDREVCREQPVLEETGQDALGSASNLYCHSIYALIEVALATWLLGGPAMGLSQIGGRDFSMFGFFCFLLSLRMLWVVLPRIPAVNWVPLYTKPMTLAFWIAWAMLGRLLLLGTVALLVWDFFRTTKLLDQQLGVKFDKRALPRLLGGTGQITGLGCAYYLEIVAVYCLSAFVYMVFFS